MRFRECERGPSEMKGWCTKRSGVGVGPHGIHAYRQGPDPGSAQRAVVLLHGLGNSLEVWRRTIEMLPDHIAVLAIDIPGFGWSCRPLNFSLQSVAHEISAFIESFDYRRITIVGHSLGGVVAVSVAQDLEDKVDILVLLSSPPFTAADILRNPLHGFLHLGVARNLLFQLMAASVHLSPSATRSVFRSPRIRRYILGHFMRDADGVEPDILAELLHSHGKLPMRDLLRIARQTNITEMLASLKARVIAARGVDDSLVTGDDIRRLCDAVPGTRSVEFALCGHWPHIEIPNEVVTLIVDGSQNGP
jgi:pimeloyl-ACP methyl ester carboxylesterase